MSVATPSELETGRFFGSFLRVDAGIELRGIGAKARRESYFHKAISSLFLLLRKQYEMDSKIPEISIDQPSGSMPPRSAPASVAQNSPERTRPRDGYLEPKSKPAGNVFFFRFREVLKSGSAVKSGPIVEKYKLASFEREASLKVFAFANRIKKIQGFSEGRKGWGHWSSLSARSMSTLR